MLGDILASSKPGMGRTEAYIDHLKELFGVKEDQELAKALGSTKAAIANWRRRDTIPAAIRNRIAEDFGSEHLWWQLADGLYRSRWEDTAYAAVLFIMEQEALPEFDPQHSRPEANIYLKGAIFDALLKSVRSHVRDHLGDVAHDQVLNRLLEDYDAAKIKGVREAVSLAPRGRQ